MSTEQENLTISEQNLSQENTTEYVITLIVGGIAGALLGVAVAHALAERKKANFSAKEGIKLAMVLIGAAKQISSLVSE